MEEGESCWSRGEKAGDVPPRDVPQRGEEERGSEAFHEGEGGEGGEKEEVSEVRRMRKKRGETERGEVADLSRGVLEVEPWG